MDVTSRQPISHDSGVLSLKLDRVAPRGSFSLAPRATPVRHNKAMVHNSLTFTWCCHKFFHINLPLLLLLLLFESSLSQSKACPRMDLQEA